MTSALQFIATDMGVAHALAIASIFGLWAFYSSILKLFGRGGSLNEQLHVVRRQWIEVHEASIRQHRVIDAIMLGHISGSISFFGSATLLVLAGLVGSLFRMRDIYAAAMQLPFIAPVSLNLFTLYFGVITVILALSFLAFTYAMRKMSYCFALMGALPGTPSDEPPVKVMVEETAVVLTEAVRSINNGIRGFYYAIAAIFLFMGPLLCLTATAGITALLYYRQLLSPTAAAIGRYVKALNRLEGH